MNSYDETILFVLCLIQIICVIFLGFRNNRSMAVILLFFHFTRDNFKERGQEKERESIQFPINRFIDGFNEWNYVDVLADYHSFLMQMLRYFANVIIPIRLYHMMDKLKELFVSFEFSLNFQFE